ncbi:MAG: M28 family peptidase [Planctomycetaceae bacterium]|nr:M28 family peptidase [Planctomycetaceae bacterium]
MDSLSLLLTVYFAATPSTTPVAPTVFVSAIQPADIRPHVEFLAGPELRGRSGADSRRAADYIVEHFRRCQLKPLFGPSEFYQSIPGVTEPGGGPQEIGRNVGAWCEGSDPVLKHEYVVIGVHYDHLGVRDGQTFAGADDNATGVAMMLEVAKRASQSATKPKRSLVFVGFDLEERMLWGSRWFAAHPPWPLEQVKLFLTADMIGRSLGDLPLPAVFVLGSEHAPQLKSALDRVGHPEGLEIARLGIDLVGTRSDYGPFRDRKVPFLFFSTGEHPDYHTPRDVPAKVDYEKAARVSGLAWQLVNDVANTAEPPIWTDAVSGDLDEPRALERITTLLLEAESDTRPLTDVQRYLVSTVRNRTQRIIEKGEMTADDRTWLIRMSQLLLLSVF